MRRRYRARIRQVDVDFLCLAVFGQRALPDDMAERIALRREFARGLADYVVASDRATSPRLAVPAAEVEAVAV
jgi:hypothetical protein